VHNNEPGVRSYPGGLTAGTHWVTDVLTRWVHLKTKKNGAENEKKKRAEKLNERKNKRHYGGKLTWST
jgi:hypothetical protein